MITLLTPLERCREIAGLAQHEVVIGVAPGEKHERLLAKYRSARRSPTVARTRLVADLRAALSAGATEEAADLLIVLRQLLSLGEVTSSRRPAQRRSRITPARAPALRPYAAKEIRRDGAVILPFAAR